MDERGKLGGIGAGFSLLGGELDFEHDFQRAGGFVEPAREFGGIDGLDDVKQLGGALGFVGLEMADQVEAGSGEIGDGGSLGFKFLDIVFAELAQAEIVGLADDGGGEDLGDGEQGDGGGIAARTFGGARDAFADLGEGLVHLLYFGRLEGGDFDSPPSP